MKLFSSLRYRTMIFAGMLVLAFSFSALDQVFFGASLQAQTNTPTAAAPAAASADKDKDSGKPIVTTPSGLKYVDLVVGPGAAVKQGDHLVVNYEGTLENGHKFDSSYDRGVPFELELGVSPVIKGWTEGLATMKVGGKRKLIIPPMLGYGTDGYGDVIPPNATLIFMVEVVAIKPPGN